MRKSLLITSALGLVATALPTLAMAGAAGSSAVCGSGFFAQFDARIMNAKLEIKNGKNTKLPDTLTEKDSEIESELKANLLADLANPDIECYFVGKFSDTLGEKVAAVDAVKQYTLADVETDEMFFAKLDADQAVPAATKAANSNGRKELARFVRDMRALAKEANLLPVVELEDVFVLHGKKFGTITDFFRSRDPGDTDQVVAQKIDLGLISEEGSLFKGRKIIIFDLEEDDSLNQANMKKAFQDHFSSDDFKARLKDFQTPSLAGLVAGIKDKNAAFNAEIKKVQDAGYDVTDRRVHNHALAGGVGATVGWWQSLGGFALSISGSGDYLWGNFKAVEDKSGSTTNAADKQKLGFGFQGDVGAHYIVSPSTTLGVLVGIRGQQLNFGKNQAAAAISTKDSKGDYASKWMINPVVTLQARTFFTDTVYGALSVGYVIPMSEKDFKVENTNVDKDAKVRFQGLTGAFSVGMTF